MSNNLFKGTNLNNSRFFTKGRLLVDTYMAGKEFVRDTDYGLERMAKRHLSFEKKTIV